MKEFLCEFKIMRITKLLSADSAPAPALLARAPEVFLTLAERVTPPAVLMVGDAELENALGQVRPLEVGDVLVDEKGHFYKVGAAVEAIFKVDGEIDLMREAVYALMARGMRVAPTEAGFAIVAMPEFKSVLESVGLQVTEAEAPFEPLPIPQHRGCCGGHGHGHGGCGCGGHGHHHHEEGEECGCGCHHHEDHDEDCGCEQHDHDKGCCGHHH